MAMDESSEFIAGPGLALGFNTFYLCFCEDSRQTTLPTSRLANRNYPEFIEGSEVGSRVLMSEAN